VRFAFEGRLPAEMELVVVDAIEGFFGVSAEADRPLVEAGVGARLERNFAGSSGGSKSSGMSHFFLSVVLGEGVVVKTGREGVSTHLGSSTGKDVHCGSREGAGAEGKGGGSSGGMLVAASDNQLGFNNLISEQIASLVVKKRNLLQIPSGYFLVVADKILAEVVYTTLVAVVHTLTLLERHKTE